VIEGHSAPVPSDDDIRSCKDETDGAPDAIDNCVRQHGPRDWHGIGVRIGPEGNRYRLVPGLDRILADVAAKRGVAVRDLFSSKSTPLIEFMDCEVGRNNSTWLQNLANSTGAKVLAYRGNVHALTANPLWNGWRGVDEDGVVRPKVWREPWDEKRMADDKPVVFTPNQTVDDAKTTTPKTTTVKGLTGNLPPGGE
jgi:hypothetical protein